jgi:hypothetical protein
VTSSRHCPCNRYSNYLSHLHKLILPILIIILMLENHSPTHSCDPTVLCGLGAGIVDPSFRFIRVRLIRIFHSFVSFNRAITSFVVGWSSLNHSIVRHSNSNYNRTVGRSYSSMRIMISIGRLSKSGRDR